MDKICGAKGEGVMLKDPNSSYERKRSFKLLKVKRFEDAEATVYDYQKGTGRITGKVGALLVREKDGTEFKIGSGFDDA
jgi:DNA ligase-1